MALSTDECNRAVGLLCCDAPKANTAAFHSIQSAHTVVVGNCSNPSLVRSQVGFRYQSRRRSPHGVRISVLLHCSDDPLAIYTMSIQIPFRPPKLPYIWTFFSARLDDTALLHDLPS